MYWLKKHSSWCTYIYAFGVYIWVHPSLDVCEGGGYVREGRTCRVLWGTSCLTIYKNIYIFMCYAGCTIYHYVGYSEPLIIGLFCRISSLLFGSFVKRDAILRSLLTEATPCAGRTIYHYIGSFEHLKAPIYMYMYIFMDIFIQPVNEYIHICVQPSFGTGIQYI